MYDFGGPTVDQTPCPLVPHCAVLNLSYEVDDGELCSTNFCGLNNFGCCFETKMSKHFLLRYTLSDIRNPR